MSSDFRTFGLAVVLLGVIAFVSARGTVVLDDGVQPSSAALIEQAAVSEIDTAEPNIADTIVNGLVSTLPQQEVRPPKILNPERRAEVPEILLDTRAAIAVTDRGRVLFEQNADEPLLIASISKFMTALAALDRLSLDTPITISGDALRTEGDSAELAGGEVLSLHDALLAMLIPSSNDAAIAVADTIGGTSATVAAMNTKAQFFGLSTVQFRNVHGLTPPGNTASARDVAKMLHEALLEPTLREMLRQPRVHVTAISGQEHDWETTNELTQYLSGIIGAKTGFTNESKGTLAFAFSPLAAIERRDAELDDVGVFIVVLGSDDRFSDTESLARWVMGAYQWK